jgi:hypothetical protein
LETQHNPQPVEAPQDRIASLEDASKTLNSFGMIIFFVIVAEALLLLGLNLYQDSRFKSLNTELSSLQTKLGSAEYSTLNTQVEEVISGNERLRLILASKVKWSKFYALFNGVTPKNVQIKTIAISNEGSFKADGVTASLGSLAEALVAWNGGVKTTQSPFTFIKLNSNGYVNSGGRKLVSFTISGQVNVGILK